MRRVRFTAALTALLLLMLLSRFLSAQTRAAIGKEAPDAATTANYIRSKMLSLDGDISPHLADLVWSPANCSLTWNIDDGSTRTTLMGSLDASTAIWEVVDPNHPGSTKFAKRLRLTYVTAPGKAPASNINDEGKSYRVNWARFVFGLPQAAEVPNFQVRFTNAVNNLIKLCGGKTTPDAF